MNPGSEVSFFITFEIVRNDFTKKTRKQVVKIKKPHRLYGGGILDWIVREIASKVQSV